MSSRDEVVKQIRDAAERSVKARIEPLQQAVDEVKATLAELGDRIAGIQAAIPLANEILPEGPLGALLEQIQPPPAAPVPASGAAAGFDWIAYKEGIRSIDSAKTQVEILNAFLAAASHFSHRIGLFVLKGDRIAGWKGKGFTDFGGSDDVVKTISLVPSEDPHVGRLFSEEKTIFVSPSGTEPLLGRLPSPRPAIAALIPMAIKDKVAAFVYADHIEGGTRKVEFHAIEVLTLLTTLSIDTLATRKKVPSPSLTASSEVPPLGSSIPPAVVPAPRDKPAPAPEIEDVDAEPTITRALPLAVALPPPPPKPTPPAIIEPAKPTGPPQSIAPPSQPRISITIPAATKPGIEEPAPKPPVPPPPPPAPPKPSMPPPPAIPSFEFQSTPEETSAPPPPKPEPPPAPKTEEPAGKAASLLMAGEAGGKSTQFIPPAHLAKKAPGPIGGAPVVPAGMTPEEAKRHDEAKRFARLLVSEIKLYNETKVNAGRRAGDLYDKLKDDIDRSRQMFDDRITEDIRSKTNYFYDELVRILADGKPEILGL